MKVKNRFLTFIFICLLVLSQNWLLFFSISTNAYAKLTTFVYARVNMPGVNLYKTTNPTSSNVYFEIPKTYFVLLIADFNELFYKAQYRDVVGYVLKDEVIPVKETPNSPYLEDHSVYVFSRDGLDIMSSPNESAYIVTTTNLYDDLSYYGERQGYEKAQGRGETWFYVKTNNGTFGYVYAGLCESDDMITENTEVTTEVKDPFLDNDSSYLYNLVDLSAGLKILLISLVILPAVILLFLMFRPILPEKYLKSKSPKATKRERKNKTIKQIQELSDDSSL